jgi:hypothetical protein
LAFAEVDVADTSGLMLLRAGLLTQEQLARANQSRRQHGGTLGCHLIALDLVSEEQLADFYRHRLMVPKIGRDALETVSKKVLAIVPPDMAAEFRVVPVSVDREGNLTLAMADPSDTHAVDEVGFFTGHFVMRAVTTESVIAWALDKYYSIATDRIPTAEAPPPPAEAAPAAAPETPAPAAPPAEAEPTPAPPGDGEVVLLTKPKKGKGRRGAKAAAEPAPAAAAEAEAAVEVTVKDAAAAEAEVTVKDAAAAEPAPAPVPPAPSEVVVEAASTADAELAPVLLAKPSALPAAPAGDEGVTLVHVELSTSGRIAAVTTQDAPAASPAARALTQAVRALRETDAPEGVATALLDYFGSFCERTAFFTVRKGRLHCDQSRGPDITAALPDFNASVEDPSVFRDVIAGRFPYRGALGESPAAAALQEGLLPPGGQDVVLVPVAVRHRVVSVAYGDRLTGEPSEAGMTRVALEAGQAYERLIASRKGGGKA